MISSIQDNTSKHSSGKDLPEYVFKTCLSCFGKKVQTKNYQGHGKSEEKYIKTKINYRKNDIFYTELYIKTQLWTGSIIICVKNMFVMFLKISADKITQDTEIVKKIIH